MSPKAETGKPLYMPAWFFHSLSRWIFSALTQVSGQKCPTQCFYALNSVGSGDQLAPLNVNSNPLERNSDWCNLLDL